MSRIGGFLLHFTSSLVTSDVRRVGNSQSEPQPFAIIHHIDRHPKILRGPHHLMTLFFLPITKSLPCGLHEYGHSPVYKCFSVEHMKDHLTNLNPLLSVILEHCSKNTYLFFPSRRVFSIGN